MTEVSHGEQRCTAVVIDDSTVVRYGVPLMHPEMQFVGTYADVDSFLDESPDADVVVLDLRLSGAHQDGVCQGAAAITKVRNAGYRVCIYTDERRRLVLAQCLGAGAHGVVHKSDSAQSALEAFLAVASGRTVISQSLVGLAEVLERRGGLPSLTERQRCVLAGRARGETWAEIAGRLYITEGVAREHMAAVNAKLAAYLHGASAADIERHLGLSPGDLLDQAGSPSVHRVKSAGSSK